jgi:hypothetical protein
MKKVLLLAIILLVPFSTLVAQQQDVDLNQMRDKMTRHMENQMSGWQHRHGSLIQGSKDVVIELWTLPNRIVKISMMERKSVDDARERLSQFAREEGDVQPLHGFGDEAYSWGDEGANIIFRRGKYTIYVTTIADVDRDSDASTLTRQARHARIASEMKRLSKEVAKQAADALDSATKN